MLSVDYNVARAASGATCDESSHVNPDHTCLNALLDDDSQWQTDGEGAGAWIKVSFPRANVHVLGVTSVCDGSHRVKALTADLGSTGSDLVDVRWPCYFNPALILIRIFILIVLLLLLLLIIIIIILLILVIIIIVTIIFLMFLIIIINSA